MCGPSFGTRFFFTWPRASMTKTDPFALKLAQIEAEKAKIAAEKLKESPPSDKPKKKPMPPQSEFKIAPFSAQVQNLQNFFHYQLHYGEIKNFFLTNVVSCFSMYERWNHST
jgi:hypothetical protein